MSNQAIAKHLNVAETAIIKIEKWATVLFVVVHGLGARFVSKKVMELKGSPKQISWATKIKERQIKEASHILETLEKIEGNEAFSQAELIAKYKFGINKMFSINKCLTRCGLNKPVEEYQTQNLIKIWKTFIRWMQNVQDAKFWIEKGDFCISYLFELYLKKYVKKG